MRRKIAIVGANGFVGRHVLQALVLEARDGVAVVRSEAGARVVEQLGGTPFRVADLGRVAADRLVPLLENCQGLVYTASVSAGPGVPDRTDPSGLVNILEACRQAGVPNLVFFSGLGIAHYGMNPHCTNPYFLSKMAGEVALFRSGLAITVFRPSYIFGPGDEFLSPLIARIALGSGLEIAGSGHYRLQPISVRDTLRAVLGAIDQSKGNTRVVDLVGPEVLSYRSLVERVAVLMGRAIEIRERPLEEALALARESGYFGLRPSDLACLLCDEVSDPGAVRSLVGGELESLESMIQGTLDAYHTRGQGA